jgi:hypothetical protein
MSFTLTGFTILPSSPGGGTIFTVDTRMQFGVQSAAEPALMSRRLMNSDHHGRSAVGSIDGWKTWMTMQRVIIGAVSSPSLQVFLLQVGDILRLRRYCDLEARLTELLPFSGEECGRAPNNQMTHLALHVVNSEICFRSRA